MCALLATLPAGAAKVTPNVPFVDRETGPVVMDVSVPDGAGLFPAVILVHGGSWIHGNRLTYLDPMFQPLTRAKFAWFTIDYRIGMGITIEDQIADTQAALDFVYAHAAEYHVDPKRIALLGESAGGFLVDYVAAKNTGPAKIAAVVSFYSPTDMTRLKGQVKAARPGLVEVKPDIFVTSKLTADEIKTRAHGLSPMFMVHSGMAPTLVLHGNADELVPFEQGPRYCETLKSAGNQCELYVVEGGRHGMGSWEEHADQLAYKEKVVAWLKKELK